MRGRYDQLSTKNINGYIYKLLFEKDFKKVSEKNIPSLLGKGLG